MSTSAARIKKATKEIILPIDDRITAIVPEARDVLVDEKPMIAIPHTTEITRICRNLDYIVPAPIVYHYPWPSNPPPFKTQKITAALLTMNPRAYVLSEMGTGKTRAALFACDYMFKCEEIKKVLIVAPLSTLSQVWDREIFQYFGHLRVSVVHGTRAARIKKLQEDSHFYVINHDGVGVVKKELKAQGFDVIIIDEIACFRNARTDRWENLYEVAKNIRYAWGMTGSPTPTAPTDAWGIAKMLTPSRAPKYFTQFKRKTMLQVTQFRWVPKHDANDHVYGMLQPAVRYKRDDCVELPPVSYETIEIEQSKQIKNIYSKFIKKLTVAFNEGLITAMNEGVLFMKLLQIASGWVYTSDRRVVSLDNRNRIQQLLDVYEQASGKVICFVSFKHAARELNSILKKKHIKTFLITGDVSKNNRDKIFGSFQNDKEKSLLVAHPQVMSHGLTLTAANTIVWFTPTTSLEIYEQANARITRPGQERKTLIIHLTGSPVESKIYSRLKQRATVQGALLDMFNDN